jgi:hypothetical protein
MTLPHHLRHQNDNISHQWRGPTSPYRGYKPSPWLVSRSCCRPGSWRQTYPWLVQQRRRASFPGSYGRAGSPFDSIDTFLPWSGRRCPWFLLRRRRRRRSSTIQCLYLCLCLAGSTDPLLLCPLFADDPPPLCSLHTDRNIHEYGGRKLY